MFEFLFFKLRLAAIKNVAIVLKSNPFSGPYSPSQIENARHNRELNRAWFIRNFNKVKKKLSNEEFDQLVIDLGLTKTDIDIIQNAINQL